MKAEIKQLLLATKIALWVLWPLTATAATITFGERMASLSWLALVMTAILSTLSGVTSLLHAMKQAYERDGEIKRLGLFVASHMFGSNVAGFAMFFVAEGMSIADTHEAAAIMFAAFGGTWVLERAMRSFADRYLPEAKQ